MGVYTLREISRRNYDSARGASPLGRYHNSWGIFLVARTCPHINEFITQGNRKMNADRDADRLFSSALPLTRSNSALSRSLSTTYEMGKPWDKRRRTVHLHPPCLQLAPTASCLGDSPPFFRMYERDTIVTDHVTSVTAPVMSITPLLWASRSCYERDHSCAAWLHKIARARCLTSYGFPSNKCAYMCSSNYMYNLDK